MNNFINYLEEQHYIDLYSNWQLIDYFDNFVLESFNKHADIFDIKKDKNSFETFFIIDEVKYVFMVKIQDDLAVIVFFPLDKELDIFKERKSNTRYIGKLFGSVIHSTRLMLKEFPDINTIGFTAENKKLENIYNLLNKTIQQRFPNWKFKSVERNKQGKLNYTYTRNF